MSDIQPISFPEQFARFAASVVARPPVHCPVEDLFAPGVYLRKCTIPAGTEVVGAAHKTQHFCVVLQGRIRVATDTGQHEFVAGDIIVSKAGDQRAGYALEDTVWVTIHPNPDDGQDLTVIVPRLVHATVELLQGGEANPQALAHSGDSTCLSSTPVPLP